MLIRFYTTTATGVSTQKSTWHFSELGPQADTEKTYKCSKWMWVVKDSLKPDIVIKNNQGLDYFILDHFLACRPLHLWKNFLKLLTRLEGNNNKSKKQEWKRPSNKMQSRNLLCLWILPEGFYRKFKQTNLLKALHVFASGSGTGVHC